MIARASLRVAMIAKGAEANVSYVSVADVLTPLHRELRVPQPHAASPDLKSRLAVAR